MNRKRINFRGSKILRHILVLVGMWLLARHLLVPFLERLEKIPGESAIHAVRLPAAALNIRYWIDQLETDGETALELKGWAFLPGEGAVGQETYVVLESRDETYVFDTMRWPRRDITDYFQETGLNLDSSGFWAILPLREIRSGKYRVGIHVRKGEARELVYADRLIVKSRGRVEVIGGTPGESTAQAIRLPDRWKEIRYSIDRLETDGVAIVELRGWAFHPGGDAVGQEIYIVLKSEDRTYVFDTAAWPRTDVTEHFRETGWDLDLSGFQAVLPAREIEEGEYQVGIYARKGDAGGLSLTGNIVRKTETSLEVRIEQDRTSEP